VVWRVAIELLLANPMVLLQQVGQPSDEVIAGRLLVDRPRWLNRCRDLLGVVFEPLPHVEDVAGICEFRIGCGWVAPGAGSAVFPESRNPDATVFGAGLTACLLGPGCRRTCAGGADISLTRDGGEPDRCVTVDRETGYVQTARGINLGTLSETEAVAQSFVVQYVLARETFDAADYRELYRKTLAWSQGAAETEYLRDWDQSNPNGIQSRVSPNTRIQVTVKSVTILDPRSAMIRFDTERSEGGGGPGMGPIGVKAHLVPFLPSVIPPSPPLKGGNQTN
jgi:hypothetical protein